ncbi:14672_t:CDS:2 [Dentiscutata heterogama]|uniref:14672_t:CDS:1 n=1 Tax=Dentiscutata heterogama TaxID=1316150 RepID=A0ACA9K8R5_9GLOM|nr:14672_t:CDS:2 [Dentiscutata heterogama]
MKQTRLCNLCHTNGIFNIDDSNSDNTTKTLSPQIPLYTMYSL